MTKNEPACVTRTMGDRHVAHELAPDLCVHSLVGEATSHLVVRNGRSVLVDCHSSHFGQWLTSRRLPAPDLVLHTHVEPGTCREADAFPDARILVHEESVELASDRAGYEQACRTTWQNPAEWAVTRGLERYGLAGSVTILPPERPLPVAGTFREGDRLSWQDITFEVIPLPGHGRHHVGFVLALAGKPLAIFTGDLLCHPARLVNMVDLEIAYGLTSLSDLPRVLRALAERPVPLYFPATGPSLANGPAQARELADAIDAYHQALTWKSGLFHPAPATEYPLVGRYRCLHRGIYQLDNFGNCVVLIDDDGHGLIVDPGPCDYESPARLENFQRDLDLFERECGLKTMDLALVTHIHGDHYDFAPVLRERYPGCRVAAWNLVARVIEAPWDYPYPALLPWYGLGYDHVPVDDVLTEETPHRWRNTLIESVHLPGHCYCHAAYLLTFNGLRLALTGDTIQTRGESDTVDFIIANHSVPGEREGNLKAYRTLLAREIDLNLGGHGSHFGDCHALYAESVRRIEHALPYLRRLVPNGDLPAAFTRPGWPRRPASVAPGRDSGLSLFTSKKRVCALPLPEGE